MEEIVIVSAARTAVGKFGGTLAKTAAPELGAAVIKALLARTGVAAEQINEVILGQVLTAGSGQNPARQSVIKGGLAKETPGLTINAVCGSGLKAVMLAAQAIAYGDSEIVIAGGQENMSAAPHVLLGSRDGQRMGDWKMTDSMIVDGLWDVYNQYHMGITAENVAKAYSITRDMQDALALASQQKAAAAQDAGKFVDEIVPFSIAQKKGDPIIFRMDEGVRGDATAASLGALKAIEKGGVVTAGNASQQNDAAAACLVVAEDKLEELGLEPMGWFVGWAAAGVEPSRMGIGPVPAVERLFARTGLKWRDIDLVELNEAFAPQVLAVLKGWNWNDADKLNVNGSGISLGHPIGATGGRILANLMNELQRREARYGLETMCIGGGQGIAAVFERAA